MAVGEWDQRQLCPDGGCVGVIGPDGTCKVCGRAAPNWGDERKRGLLEPPDEDAGDDAQGEDGEDEDDEERDAADGHDEDDGKDADDGGEDDDEGDEAAEAPVASAPAAAAASPGDWARRTLCPDGGCIGVIGPDGRCKACGRAASESPEAARAAVSTAEPASAEQPSAPASAPVDAPTGAPVDAPVDAENAPPRARCTDATCTGMSGPDGRCEVCGKVVA